MTTMFRMCIALVFQAASNAVRATLFLLMGIIRPLDYISNWLQKIAIWFASEELMVNALYNAKRDDDER